MDSPASSQWNSHVGKKVEGYALFHSFEGKYITLIISDEYRAYFAELRQSDTWSNIVKRIIRSEYTTSLDFGEMLYYRDKKGYLRLSVIDSFDIVQSKLFIPLLEEECSIFFNTSSIKNWEKLQRYLESNIKTEADLPFDDYPVILLRHRGRLEMHLKDFDEYYPDEMVFNYLSRKPRSDSDKFRLINGMTVHNASVSTLLKKIRMSNACLTLHDKVDARK